MIYWCYLEASFSRLIQDSIVFLTLMAMHLVSFQPFDSLVHGENHCYFKIIFFRGILWSILKPTEAEWRIYVSVNWAVVDSDNGLSPVRHQFIIWSSAGLLLTGPMGTHISVIWINLNHFSFKNMHSKMASAKWRPFISTSVGNPRVFPNSIDG